MKSHLCRCSDFKFFFIFSAEISNFTILELFVIFLFWFFSGKFGDFGGNLRIFENSPKIWKISKKILEIYENGFGKIRKIKNLGNFLTKFINFQKYLFKFLQNKFFCKTFLIYVVKTYVIGKNLQIKWKNCWKFPEKPVNSRNTQKLVKIFTKIFWKICTKKFLKKNRTKIFFFKSFCDKLRMILNYVVHFLFY